MNSDPQLIRHYPKLLPSAILYLFSTQIFQQEESMTSLNANCIEYLNTPGPNSTIIQN